MERVSAHRCPNIIVERTCSSAIQQTVLTLNKDLTINRIWIQQATISQSLRTKHRLYKRTFAESWGTEKITAWKQHKDNARTVSKKGSKRTARESPTETWHQFLVLSAPSHAIRSNLQPAPKFFAIILNSKNTKDDYTDLQQNIRHLLQCLFEILNGQTGRVSKPQHPSFGIQ